MKKTSRLFFLIPILSFYLISCSEEYKYTVYKVDPENKYDTETLTETISAKDDLEAYRKGLMKFTSSVSSAKILNKTAPMRSYRSKEAERYSLLNKKGENVSDIIDSKKRDKILMSLLSIAKGEAKKYELEIDDKDIIGRDHL